ncbi:MAG: LysM peptidoglycan-binding domain-containing protein [Patescibacteria group bacterium]|nr:LysM peptidoglycan-binding domain-containing protein [Patescibacteria group bacterium]
MFFKKRLVTLLGLLVGFLLFFGTVVFLSDVRAASFALSCPSGLTYVVRPGDNLADVGNRFGVSVSILAEVNQIANVNLIRSGEELCIPVMNQPDFVRVSFPKFANSQYSGIETVSVNSVRWFCGEQHCDWEGALQEIWVLDEWYQTLFSHRYEFPGSHFPKLEEGDKIVLYRNWDYSGEARLRVTGMSILGDRDDVDINTEIFEVLERTADGELFAFITCHPAGAASPVPQRWVVWARKELEMWNKIHHIR